MIYESGKTRWELYLFGIPLRKVRDRIKEKEKEIRKAKKPEGEPSVAPEKKRKDPCAPKREPGEDSRSPYWKRKQRKRFLRKKRGNLLVLKTIKKLKKSRGYEKNLKKIKRVRLTFHNICVNIKEWRSFFALETTKAAFRFLLGKGKGLLHHILPRKIKEKANFLDLKNPASDRTGVLGVAAIFYSFYQDKFLLTPVFDRQILEGEIKLLRKNLRCILTLDSMANI